MPWCTIWIFNSSFSHLARNTQILQIFFLQDLQDLALNLAQTYLANLALKMMLFLQDIKNLARILQERLQDNFLARFWLRQIIFKAIYCMAETTHTFNSL